MPWHALDAADVLTAHGSTIEGLDSATAGRRLAEHGPNVIPRGASEGPLTMLVRQVNTPLIYVLIGSGLLAIAMGKEIDGAVVLGVVVVNALIGFIQEYRAGKAIESLIDMVPDLATVVRAGVRSTVPAADLVPGDIVVLQSGDKVPADVRLIAARGLQVEEAALTGESIPVAKTLAALPTEAALADRLNMAYGGTLVTSGTATALVVGTGARTELGRISTLLGEATTIETPLTRQFAAIGKWLTVGIVAVAVVLFAVGLLRGYPLVSASIAAITLAVGAIPEGLPAIMTIALAIGVQRMARRRAIIRRLPAVETLGSTTVICSDKTGTLTRNEMTVTAVWTPSGRYWIDGVGYRPLGDLRVQGSDAPLIDTPDDVRGLLLAGVLCNDAQIRRDADDWLIDGDPTEAALVVAARKVGLDEEAARRAWPRLDAIPFESERQYMATLNAGGTGPDPGLHEGTIVAKGAPEVIIRRCRTLAGGTPLDSEAVLAEVEALASEGMRVLAVARRRLPAAQTALGEEDVQAEFELLGLQGMIDPPRPEAIAAIQTCHQAGIAVKMITGDHRVTAEAIGRQLGLVGAGSRAVVGRDLAGMSDEELRAEVARTNVFARVAPEHKLRIVRALQAEGNVVAMTGDGVNDAPALKQADIGVAMGITGTAVSKESADIVLTDDNFASIAAAVEEGRRVYDNLVKALAFLLPTNIGLAMILTAAVAGFPIVDGEPLLPMLPTQILWINLVASVALALPLAFEAKEPGLMRRAPRRPGAPIFDGFLALRTVYVALLMAGGAIGLFNLQYYSEIAHGVPADLALREAQTMAVTTVILFQVFYLLNCRSLRDSLARIGFWSNPTVYVGIAALLLLQAAFVYLPFMQVLFGTAALGWDAWLEAMLAALILVPVISLEKWWRQRRHRADQDAAGI
ncbi:MAG: HAD-IC family P-type ATPase [Chloroflexi bacterium]|nr:HAD-IC family P-type ATPase [Chloroflexota bacterium]